MSRARRRAAFPLSHRRAHTACGVLRARVLGARRHIPSSRRRGRAARSAPARCARRSGCTTARATPRRAAPSPPLASRGPRARAACHARPGGVRAASGPRPRHRRRRRRRRRPRRPRRRTLRPRRPRHPRRPRR
eukprot:3275165-Prymnesium_polylepis.1